MGESAESSGPKRRQPLGSGRPGKVRAALSEAIRQARAGGRMSVEHEVRALLADRYAAAVDRASSEGDAAALLRAGDKLLELLDTLPLVVDVEESEGGGAGVGSGERGKVLGIIHGGPTVGDAADS